MRAWPTLCFAVLPTLLPLPFFSPFPVFDPALRLPVFANKLRPPRSAILHTIFFHRYFIPIVPVTRDLLDQTLPAIDDVDLETLIDQRATSLVRAIEPATGGSSPSTAGVGRVSSGGGGSGAGGQSGRAQITVSFYEKKRRKGYFFGKTDEEVCWEVWTLDVTCATPRTETGKSFLRSTLAIPCLRGFPFSFLLAGLKH
jgi:hypothetical protein